MQEPSQQTGEEETVDAVPVLAEARPVERRAPAAPVVAQAAAVAATGFVAGAATFAVLRRRSLGRRLGGSRRRQDLGPVVASRTFVVRVDVLGDRGR
jgi:hypothetical protein